MIIVPCPYTAMEKVGIAINFFASGFAFAICFRDETETRPALFFVAGVAFVWGWRIMSRKKTKKELENIRDDEHDLSKKPEF